MPVKNCIKMHPNIILRTKNISGKSPPNHHIPPPRRRPTANRPLLTEILKTPVCSTLNTGLISVEKSETLRLLSSVSGWIERTVKTSINVSSTYAIRLLLLCLRATRWAFTPHSALRQLPIDCTRSRCTQYVWR